MESLGRHILVEFFNCNPEILNDVMEMESSMFNAATISGATVINSHFHHFSPYGVSGVVIIQESHLSVHTWPEYQYASADLYTCGEGVNPWLAFDYLQDTFQAKNYSVLELHRGSLNLLERIPFNAENFRKIVEDRINIDSPRRSFWITDKDENIALSLRASGEVVYDQTSSYQRIRIYNSYGFGKTLTIDNMVMCTEKDEKNYHEMISHPAIFAHGNVKNVLVIGGGDGGTIREVLKHEAVENVTMVEIDEKVIEASRQYLPELSKEFDNKKLDLQIGDGIKYVDRSPAEAFDLIIIDGSDPVGPARGLFSEKFYENCKRILKKDGILVTQGESPIFNQAVFIELNGCLKKVFGNDHVEVSLFHIPTYPSGIWSFQIASKDGVDLTKIDEQKVAQFVEQKKLTYYNERIHEASFVLPNYIAEMILSDKGDC
ncbi:polyamine aminopropyltransferase [candidate division KSB1 bacterium]|nr:polyamine aminopropyltransferase [candidate division KSB1 bacterium]